MWPNDFLYPNSSIFSFLYSKQFFCVFLKETNSRYGPLGFPEKFPYRTKAIFAFEVIDGVEVCFFGLHVQEYGSNCPPPNQRYIFVDEFAFSDKPWPWSNFLVVKKLDLVNIFFRSFYFNPSSNCSFVSIRVRNEGYEASNLFSFFLRVAKDCYIASSIMVN